MDPEERQMFSEFRGEMREGFTGVHKRVDEVHKTVNDNNEKQARTDERLTAHMNDKARHRNPEKATGLTKIDGLNGVSLKLVIYVCAGAGALIAGIIGALALL